MKSKQLSLLANVASLMIIIGYIFEVLIQWPFLATYINPNPAEGLLIFIVILFGLKSSIITFLIYFIVLFTFKGLSSILIEEVALILSTMTTIFIFDFWYHKKNQSFLKSTLITVVSNTMLMTLLNAYFITPSYIKQKWVTYSVVFPGMSFGQVLKWVILPPAGILYGNLIKYSLFFIFAQLAITTYKKIK